MIKSDGPLYTQADTKACMELFTTQCLVFDRDGEP